MSVPILMSGYAPTLGASITNVAPSLTLSTDSGDNGHVWMLIDSEIMDGDKSGTTVSNLNRASEKFNGVAAAANHNAGAVVYFILGRGMAQANFTTKIDEASGADFPAASITFPLHGSAFPTSGSLEIIYDLRSTSATTTFDILQLQLNGDTAGNYGAGQIYNSSTTAAAYSESTAQTTMTAGLVVGGGAAAGWSAKGRILIPNHAGATIKQVLANLASAWGSGGGGTVSRQIDGTWASTAAITSIKLLSSTGSIAANSLITLLHHP